MEIPEKPPLGSWTVLSFPTFANEKKPASLAALAPRPLTRQSAAQPNPGLWNGRGMDLHGKWWVCVDLYGFIAENSDFQQWKTMD